MNYSLGEICVQTMRNTLTHKQEKSINCKNKSVVDGLSMEQHLPEPLAVCLEDGLAHDDATLVDQDGGRHPVSKLILAVNSKFFLALFSRSHEDENYPITIMKRSSSTAEGLASVLSWMVRGEVEVTEENVLEVLQTAEYLHVEPVSHFCQQVILSLCIFS